MYDRSVNENDAGETNHNGVIKKARVPSSLICLMDSLTSGAVSVGGVTPTVEPFSFRRVLWLAPTVIVYIKIDRGKDQ